MDNKFKKTIEIVVKKIKQLLLLKDVKVVIKKVGTNKKDRYKDLGGVGGYCSNSRLVKISVDETHPVFKKQGSSLIEITIAHELHHAARYQAGINVSHGTFLECLWSEGLADYFAYKIIGKRPIWSKPLTDKQFQLMFKKVKNNLKRTITDKMYEDWFLKGSFKKNLPRWAGYALGFEMVKRYFKHNPKETVVSMVGIPAEKVRLEKIA